MRFGAWANVTAADRLLDGKDVVGVGGNASWQTAHAHQRVWFYARPVPNDAWVEYLLGHIRVFYGTDNSPGDDRNGGPNHAMANAGGPQAVRLLPGRRRLHHPRTKRRPREHGCNLLHGGRLLPDAHLARPQSAALGLTELPSRQESLSSGAASRMASGDTSFSHSLCFSSSLTHSLTHARTHARTHTRTHVCTHSLTHSLTLQSQRATRRRRRPTRAREGRRWPLRSGPRRCAA